MTFGNIYWLYAFLPVLVILLLGFYYLQKVRHAFFRSFAAPPLLQDVMSSFSNRRYYLKSILFLLAVFFIFLALSQPRWGYTWKDQKSKGIDILFALDVSKSMLAEDIKPNRLERAKYSMRDLVKKLEGNRFGLIAFAGTAFLQCPLTLDYNAFTECLEQTDPSVLNRGGTDIAAAIRTALPAFANENNFKILILISDGEELEDSGLSQAQTASKDNITIYTVGVGTSTGELIPIKNADNSVDYMRDSQGKIVKTKLDESNLKKIAEVTGGFYVPLGPKGEGLDEIYRSGLSKIPKQELSSTLRKIPVERFQWPLAIAIFLLTIQMMLSTRKKNSVANLLFAALLINLCPNNLDASTSAAYKAFEAGQFKEAVDLYEIETKKQPNNSSLNYNLGNSLYKNHNYESSLSAFHNAIKTQDLSLQQKAFYNLGNTLYRKGQQSLQTNPQQTIQLWEESLNYYQSSIELDPQDTQCQENIDFVKKKIEELKKENQEKQQNQKQEENDKQNQNSQENSQQESSQNNSSSNQTNNPESPPNNDQNKSSQNNSTEQSEKSTPTNDNNPNKNSDSQKSNTEEAQTSSNNPGGMTQKVAEELLKTLKNSEQKLPAVSEKSNNFNQYSDNFKDW